MGRRPSLDDLEYPDNSGEGGDGLATKFAAAGANPTAIAVEKLEGELKLLQWHKLANEAAIKAALHKAKQMHDEPRLPEVCEISKETQKLQQLIEEEQLKPLEVNRHYKLETMKAKVKADEALQKQLDVHIFCLNQLKKNIKKNLHYVAKKIGVKIYNLIFE